MRRHLTWWTFALLSCLSHPGGAQATDAPSQVSAAPAALLWPLELQPALSSTFGETRATAFHNGIDLKTWGKTGYAVRAVADGWIQRVRTSPWGYGRALYQQLADGRIAVYGHLESFAAPVAQRVQAAQRNARQYTVQLWFAADEIQVHRGQVIAYTGESGAGPPHLHVEIRDALNVPQNPLLQGLGPVADTTPPTLRRLLLVPLSASARIDGGRDPVAVTLRATSSADGPAGYEASRSVRVWGRIGMAVDSYDRADLAPNKVAALRHELHVDGDAHFTSTFERVSFADGHLVALDRLRPAAIEGVFTALYRCPGNRLSFYAGTEGDGSIIAGGRDGLPSGPHEVIVIAGDVAGNRAEARLQLEASASPQVIAARLVRGSQEGWFLEADFVDEDDERLATEIADAASGRIVQQSSVVVGAGPFTWALPADSSVADSSVVVWSLRVRDAVGNEGRQTLAVPHLTEDAEPFGLDLSPTFGARHVLLQVTSPRSLQRPPQVAFLGQSQRMQEEGPGIYRATLLLADVDADDVVIECTALAADGGRGHGTMTLSGRPARPGLAQVIELLQGKAALHMAAGSAFEVIYPQAESLMPEASEELVAAGAGCMLGPADAAFDEWARISLQVDGPLNQVGVYADDGAGRWVFIGADADGADRVSAKIRAFGRFAPMKDETPPMISHVLPESGSVVNADVEFSAEVTDNGAGIMQEQDVILELDGVLLIAEYDPEADRVTATADLPLTPGAHHLAVTVRDAVGNESVATADFISR